MAALVEGGGIGQHGGPARAVTASLGEIAQMALARRGCPHRTGDSLGASGGRCH